MIKQDQSLLDGMDEWNTTHHTDSGLLERIREEGVEEEEANKATLDFIKPYVEAGSSPLCGNTIGQDRRFLVKYMPELENYLSYRNIDVSTLQELARRLRLEAYDGVVTTCAHRAIDDIRESIVELVHYREYFF